MDLNCFETFMGLKDWKYDSGGVAPNGLGSSEISDVMYRRGTRTIIIPVKEVVALDSEDFDPWFQNKTAGFIC
jgi:hypothetical protein